MTAQTPLAYTIAETCERLGIGRTTAYRLMSSGRLPARKIAGRTLVLANDLERFLAELPSAYPAASIAKTGE